MTLEGEIASLQELLNLSQACVPCAAGGGSCLLAATVHKTLPALLSIMRRLRSQEAFKRPGTCGASGPC